MTITIEADPADLERAKLLLANVKNGARRALVNAANRTATTAQSRVVKSTAQEVNLLQKQIRPYTRIIRASTRSIKPIPTAYVFVSQEPLPAGMFPYIYNEWLGVGTSIEFRRGRAELWRHVFPATMPSGYTGLFERRYSINRVPAHRLPIGSGLIAGGASELKGPSIGNVFRYHYERTVSTEMAEVFSKNLLQQIDFIMSKS